MADIIAYRPRRKRVTGSKARLIRWVAWLPRVRRCAVSEAFNSVLKVEFVRRRTFATRTEARLRIATWISDFYNTRRLHSVCGFKSPIDYEHDYWADLGKGLAA